MWNDPGVRYVAQNALAGCLVGLIVTAVAIFLNAGHFAALKGSPGLVVLAGAMLLFVGATTFGMLHMGFAIMAMAAPEQQTVWSRIASALAVGRAPGAPR